MDMRRLCSVLIHRGERYRLYPTPEQSATLAVWDGSLRFLWNLAHGQRVAMGQRCKVDRRQITAFGQQLELTELRAMLPWLAVVPRDVCDQLLAQLDLAWQRYFQGIAERPCFKRKGRDRAPLIAPQDFRVEGAGRQGRLVFPKLGPARIVVHRPLRGRAKQCAIVRDGDAWFACVSQEIDVVDPLPSTKPVVAIDRGIAVLLAFSCVGVAASLAVRETWCRNVHVPR